MIRQYASQLVFLYKLIDVLIIFLALSCALVIRGISLDSYYLNAGLLASTFFLIFASNSELYRSWRTFPVTNQMISVFFVWTSTLLSLLVLGYLLKTSEYYSRLIMLTWFFLGAVALTGWRFWLRSILNVFRRNHLNTRSAAILGLNKDSLLLAKEMAENTEHGIRLIGFFDDRKSSRLPSNTSVLGNTGDLIALAQKGEVDNVYISFPLSAEERTLEILDLLADTTVTVSILPNFFAYRLLHSRLHSMGDVTILSVHDTPIIGVNSLLKRAEDLLIFTVVFPLLLIPIFLIGIAIRVTSKGPVVFRQRRYGLDGKKFDVLKFRTMTTEDNGDLIVQVSSDDERVTPLGRFLRRFSLDELPQIFNVINGTMSFVGPRPHAVAHNEYYRKRIRGYMLRHKVKPGITGWAQVNGFRGETDTLEKMKNRVDYDLNYIQNWSLIMDLKIMYLTVANSKMITSNAC